MAKKGSRVFQYVQKEDYDQSIKLKQGDLAVYSKEKLEELYADEDYHVVGEAYPTKKADPAKDLGTLQANGQSIPVRKVDYKKQLFRKQSGFAEVDGGKFVAFLKLRILPFIILGVLLLGIIAGVIAIIALNQPTPIDPAEQDPYIKPIDSELLTVSGSITEDTLAFDGASLVLKSGSKEIASTITGSDGKYLFADVKKGIYNLVCTCGDSVQSKIAEVDGTSITVDFAFQADTKLKSLVKVVDDGENTISIAVNGLTDEAQEYVEVSKEVDISLIAEQKAASEIGATEKNAIEALTGELELTYYDFSILKEVYNNNVLENSESITKTQNVLELVVPYDSSRAIATYVIRYHGDSAARFTELESRPASDYVDGTYYVTKNYVFIYADSFSYYVIGSAFTDTSVKGSDTFTYANNLTVNLTTGKITMLYKHDTSSSHDARIELYLVGEEANLKISESGIIPIGYQLEEMQLLNDVQGLPSVGSYSGLLRILYVGETAEQISTQVDIPVTVTLTR